MATWNEFTQAAPEIAAVGEHLLEKHHLAYLATVRADGAPRVHPVSPFIIEGRLYVATPPSSPKARDQLRDGRYVLHMLPGENDDEFRIRGHARSVTADRERALLRERGSHFLKEDDYYFEYDIEEAATAYWVNVGQPGTYPMRSSWKEKRA
jgi:general stress protein 26